MNMVHRKVENREVYLQRVDNGRAIGIYGPGSEEPFATVPIPNQYRRTLSRRHRFGKGSTRQYQYPTIWLVKNVPEIQQGVKEAVNQRDIRNNIGV